MNTDLLLEKIMGGMSIAHWVIVMIVILIVAGTGRLKNVGKELGDSIRSFKEAVKTEKVEEDKK